MGVEVNDRAKYQRMMDTYENEVNREVVERLEAEIERLREIEAWAGPRLGNCRRWSVSGISQCGEAGYQCSDCRVIIAKHQGGP